MKNKKDDRSGLIKTENEDLPLLSETKQPERRINQHIQSGKCKRRC